MLFRSVGMSYAFYDEGAYRNALKNGDMRTAHESIRLVNSVIVPVNDPVT